MENSDLACSDKLAFDTEKQALASATMLKWRNGTSLKAYQCKHCGLWHLSSH